MRWPWQRREPRPTSLGTLAATQRAEEAQRRAQAAYAQSDAIARRAEDLVRDLPAGELYLRLARAFHRGAG